MAGQARTATIVCPASIVLMAIVIDRLNVCARRAGVERIAMTPYQSLSVVSGIHVKMMASASTLLMATTVVSAGGGSLVGIVRLRVSIG